MKRILLIDDDPLITEPLARRLSAAGYQVLVASNGRKGLHLALEGQPDLVVLDIFMPEMDGWEVCRALREKSVVPILMLSAQSEEVDRILGLELGADDYLTKPFSMRELIARIRAMLRRVELDQSLSTERSIKIGPLDLDLDARRVFQAGKEHKLRHKEFELLSLLMSKAGQSVSRGELLDGVWGIDWIGDTRTLDVHVRMLRKRIEENPSKPRYIQTVRGVGYRFISAQELKADSKSVSKSRFYSMLF